MLDNRKAGDIPEINGKLVKVNLSSLDSITNKLETVYFMDFFFLLSLGIGQNMWTSDVYK